LSTFNSSKPVLNYNTRITKTNGVGMFYEKYPYENEKDLKSDCKNKLLDIYRLGYTTCYTTVIIKLLYTYTYNKHALK